MNPPYSGAVRPQAAAALAVIASLAALAAPAVQAQAVTPMQRGVAQQVASAGVSLADLAPNAPEEYTVRRGDTLWRISGLFLKSPWRWPELWGMNLGDIRNPHLIFPGQQLELDRSGGRARLRVRSAAGAVAGEPPTIRVSPRNRVEALDAAALPTLQPHLVEPFLNESLILTEDLFKNAPRIVATEENRVVVSKGDRAYARGLAEHPLLLAPGLPSDFRVLRAATPLKDPITGEILGYEGQYVGQAQLVRGESETDEPIPRKERSFFTPTSTNGSADGRTVYPVAAKLDITASKEEIRVGDRLVAEPPRQFRSYVPHAPSFDVDALVVSLYGNAVRYAGGNQVISINKGMVDGMQTGQVLAILSTGKRIVDKTDPNKPIVKLPDERNGLGMVFRAYDRVSYVLVMQALNPIVVGDRLVTPGQ